MAKEPRFPNIDWYCDHCGALLNNQRHFDDHKYIWRCTKCGYKNSISWNNCRRDGSLIDDSFILKCLLHLIGFLSYIGLWTGFMLGIAIYAFGADKDNYFTLFLASVGLYFFAYVLTILVEFGLRHTGFSVKNFLIVIFRNLKEDILLPLLSVWEVISGFLCLITKRLSYKHRYIWRSNRVIIGLAIIRVLILMAEFVALSRIIGFGMSDWSQLITAAINSIF